LGIVELPGTIAFRPPGCLPTGSAAEPPPDDTTPAATPDPIEGRRSFAVPSVPPPPRVERRRAQPAAPRDPLAPRPAAPDALVGAIRGLADTGRLQEAAQASAEAIDTYPLDARLHFYDGVIAQAAGQRTRAEAALRRAIYLSGSMVMAHYHLGLLLLDGATPEAGRRIMAQVMKLCATLPETDILPESDGLTPRDLGLRIEMRLRPRRAPGG
jgi:chemotaxis protein methyltransferase CheR